MSFTFIDLFSGIVGFHVGLSSIGGTCVMAADIDRWANETYKKNFNIDPTGDICTIHSDSIPEFDILCAGFPCQPFSNIGLGGGLDDPRGTLITEVFRILKDKQPKAYILENVKGLLNHNKGNTMKYIVTSLEKCGYNVFHKILEAKDFNLPQIRKRLFIVGIKNSYNASFDFPTPIESTKSLSDVMGGETEREFAFTIRIGGRKSGRNNKYNWDCYMVNGEPRYITIEECLELQGFPRDFYLAGGLDKKFKQVGNSVPTTIIREIGRKFKHTGII